MYRKLLLTSVYKPFGERYGECFLTTSQSMFVPQWAQGIFRVSADGIQYSLDFIAANLECPTVVLHYPDMKGFIREIRKNHYDYIGISFSYTLIPKMIKMSEAIRRYSPDSKIILGGYGTILNEVEGFEGSLERYADYICCEEGVTFMRKLLGEDINKPIVQPNVVSSATLFNIPLDKNGLIFGGLGCPNGCDFCFTSHYFKRKHIKFLKSGREIFDAITRLRVLNGDALTRFFIIDEDFLLNKKLVNELHRCIVDSDLPPLSISVFGSVKALSRLSIEKLAEMGICAIWIGFEGKRAGYDKMKGRSYEELFKELKSYGITVTASMIIGFDYQTPEIIREEFEELISLNPTETQILIYSACPSTPLYERMKGENRLLPYNPIDNPEKFGGDSLVFTHPVMTADELSDIRVNLCVEEYERLGPSIFRMMDDKLAGVKNLVGHPSKRIRKWVEQAKNDLHRVLKIMDASRLYLNDNQKAFLDSLKKEIEKLTGPLTPGKKLLSKAAYPLLWWENRKMTVSEDGKRRYLQYKQPATERYIFN